MSMSKRQTEYVVGKISEITLSPVDNEMIVILKITGPNNKNYIEYFRTSLGSALYVQKIWNNKKVRMILGESGPNTIIIGD